MNTDLKGTAQTMSLTRKPPPLWMLLLSVVSVALLVGAAPPAAQATNVSFAPNADYPTGEFPPQSLAIGDLNGDGKPDMAVANGPSDVSVLFNKGDGSFEAEVEYPSGFAPQSLAIGDLNGDGKPDLAVALGSNKVSVLLNNGDGSFASKVEYAAGSDPVSIAIGDLNGDGKPDLAVADEISESVSVLLGNGDGSFTAAVGYATGSHPLSVKIGDLNGDGKPDLAVANWGSNSVSVLLGKGDGSFESDVEYPAGSEPTFVAIGDLNGDGKPDLVAANRGSNSVSVLLGKGDGSFESDVEYQAGFLAVSVAIGDLNGDGKPDLAVVSLSSTGVSVLLGNGDGSFEAAVGFPAGSEPTFVAIGDLNGDGKPDLAVDRFSGSVSVLLNSSVFRGNGTFEPKLDYPTTREPRSMAIGDLNGDGKPDLAVANYSSPAVSTTVSILLNNGDGTFEPKVDYTTGNTPQSVAIGDLNGDGKPDLAVADATSNTVSILLNNGDGTFKTKVDYPTGSDPTSVAIGDLNGDGKPDLAVVDHLSNKVSILLNNGNGTFAAKTDYTAGTDSFSVAIGDLNGDGKPDLAVANSNANKVSILLNSGSGAFPTKVEYATGSHPIFLAIGDLNGDGKPDLAVSNELSNTVSILLNHGDGTFEAKTDYVTGAAPTGVAIGDLNGDGKPDLAVAGIGSSTVSVLLSNGDGTFKPKADYTTGAGPEALAIGDLNGDGRLDLAVGGVTFHEVSVLLGNDKFNQMITFTAPSDRGVGASDFDPGATASSGLPVTYASQTEAVCTIVVGEIHIVGAGKCEVTAKQEGDGEHNAATPVQQSFQVTKAIPTISTTASDALIGGQIFDEATVSGRIAPTEEGEVEFKLYGPNDTGCENGPIETVMSPALQTEPAVSTAGYTPTEAGDYYWTARYTGDVNNEAVESSCEEVGETSTVAKVTPSIPTNASAAIAIGAKVKDAATLSGGYNPTGTVTFKLYGPGDETCTGAAVYTSPAVALSAGSAESPEFEPTEAGTYHWVASYSGDANNDSVAGACNDSNESVTVAKAEPTISTTPGGPVTVGATLEDEVKVENRINPQAGSTVEFKLYPPSDQSCSGTAVYTHSVSYPGTGEPSVSSGTYTTTEAGTYHWSAIYFGDANNQSASSLCTEASEANKATPTLATIASAAITIGAKITDAATLSGGYNPTGTITFTLYGPGDETCSGAPAFTGTTIVSDNGSYDSAEFEPTEAGAYRWVAEYSGDSNNDSVSGACSDPNESVAAAKATPTISTQSSADIRLGATIADKATLAAGHLLSGSIVFRAYGPDDATCSGAPAFTSGAVPVSGNGDYASPEFTPTATGTYRWVASYSGDANNQAVSGSCGEPNESVTVASAVCEPVKAQVGNYVPKEFVPKSVPGVRARLRVPEPSVQQVHAVLHFRWHGEARQLDLGDRELRNPGARNVHLALPVPWQGLLPLRTKVLLELEIASTPRSSGDCVDPAISHRKLHTRVVRVLDK